MAHSLNWGILSTGKIAHSFAKDLAESKTGKLVAVASRSQESADKFAAEFGGIKAHGSYEAMMRDPQVQAVYIATPHPMHAEWAIKFANAGKHLLVEKPIAMNAAETMAIIEAARANDVFLMEAFMYRCHPQTQKLIELIKQKTIGDVRVIQATFSFHWPKPWNDQSRLISNALGGGGILDVGCYAVSAARLVAGVAQGLLFADPTDLKAVAHVGKTGVDEYAIASLKFPGDILAQCATGVQVNQDNSLRIYGTEGSIHLPHPWNPSKNSGAKIIIHQNGKDPEELPIDPGPIYAYEADTVAKYLEQRQSPTMSLDDTLGNMRALDQWRQQIGVIYESEKSEKFPNYFSGDFFLSFSNETGVSDKGNNPYPTAPPEYKGREIDSGVAERKSSAFNVHRSAFMQYGKIPGVQKKVSRLIMGCDNQPSYPHAAVMFDHYFSYGGNTFDTAHIYGGGTHEKLLGQWIKARNVREQVIILSKGAHTPFCDPKNLTSQLLQSLERLQTDYADIYLMHRDNPEVPVGEFVDVLNEHHKAGRVRAFGGSNWSLARLQAANEYAAGKNLQGFFAVSNQFSLARMVEPPWGGCLSANDAAFIAWLKQTQTPLLAWSSQARGFFVPGRAAPERKEDAELVRCWYASDNFQRLERVKQLAAEKNVEPINIAAAYVLQQDFPTFALIGPRAISETRSSLAAISISLSRAERQWLNLESDSRK
ncbi:MAG TPA: aldo/keto reductase [Tepidisphaeraceae bacterium]|jgi:predicted dehydrogenase/aryl-alcohol dehydrogenase-like predicted oxidoreductase